MRFDNTDFNQDTEYETKKQRTLLYLFDPDVTAVYLILWRLSVTLTLGVIGALSHLIEPGDKSCDSRLVYEVLCVCLSLIQLTNINWMTWGGKEQSPRFLGFIAPEERGIQTNGFSAQCQVAIKALKYNQWYQGAALASRVPLCSQERESRAWWHYNPHTQETDSQDGKFKVSLVYAVSSRPATRECTVKTERGIWMHIGGKNVLALRNSKKQTNKL